MKNVSARKSPNPLLQRIEFMESRQEQFRYDLNSGLEDVYKSMPRPFNYRMALEISCYILLIVYICVMIIISLKKASK